VIDLQNHTRIT